jgi:ABC-type transport system involved in cytochrome bd biosynthesis fused ATPase/permease subunit
MPDTTHESQPSMNAQSHAAAAPIVVRLRGATKTYPNGLRALEPIDLCVREGELTTLLGPSGCGKSTLLRMVAKLTMPTIGTIALWPDAQAQPANTAASEAQRLAMPDTTHESQPSMNAPTHAAPPPHVVRLRGATET